MENRIYLLYHDKEISWKKEANMNLFFHKYIIVAADFSECSKVTLDIGISASKCMKTEIYILHTIEKLHRDYTRLILRLLLLDYH